MRENFDLIAELREDKGKGASRRLRREGKVPAIIYGAGRPPRSLTFDHNKVIRQLQNESFYSSILNIKVTDKSQAAIVKDIQRHPSRPQILHMDFQRIVEDQKIRMNELITDIEVTCLPKDLPEYFEVDIENLGLNEMLYISDIPLPEGVEIPILAQGPENDRPIVSIQYIKEVVIEEEVEELEAEAVEGEEVEGEEGAPEEGAAEAEGEGEEKPEE
jgi:large subunit ribosomal protein L25